MPHARTAQRAAKAIDSGTILSMMVRWPCLPRVAMKMALHDVASATAEESVQACATRPQSSSGSRVLLGAGMVWAASRDRNLCVLK